MYYFFVIGFWVLRSLFNAVAINTILDSQLKTIVHHQTQIMMDRSYFYHHNQINTFHPDPPNVNQVDLEGIEPLIAKLSLNTHESWAKGELEMGYVYGEENTMETNGNLKPFEDLDEEGKQLYEKHCELILKTILCMGFRIKQKSVLSSDDLTLGLNNVYDSWCKTAEKKAEGNARLTLHLKQFNEKSPTERRWVTTITPGKYQPQPIAVGKVTLDPVLSELADLLAEDLHNRWSYAKFKDGFVYGPQPCNPEDNGLAKTHNRLVPFCLLDMSDKRENLNIVSEVLKAVDLFGYDIECRVNNNSTLCLMEQEYMDQSLKLIDQCVKALDLDRHSINYLGVKINQSHINTLVTVMFTGISLLVRNIFKL